ncbi:MAG: hypothetical protein NUW37_15085 [Planctomycetes bacterium]|nr:hypothetical protein [Planctomycetota bacterium]
MTSRDLSNWRKVFNHAEWISCTCDKKNGARLRSIKLHPPDFPELQMALLRALIPREQVSGTNSLAETCEVQGLYKTATTSYADSAFQESSDIHRRNTGFRFEASEGEK